MRDTLNNSNKILSIQILLGGLSFYSHEEKKYSIQQLSPTITASAAITKEDAKGDFESLYIFHNSLSYVMVPEPIYDDNMREIYLQAKGVDTPSSSDCYVSSHSGIVYVSLLNDSIVPQFIEQLDIFPLIAKAVIIGQRSEDKALYYIVDGNRLDMVYIESKRLLFCESYTIVSDSDVLFFIGAVGRKSNTKGDYKIVSLYENGDFVLSRDVIERLGIERYDNQMFIEAL